MTVLALVFGAAILLTWILVHSYSRRATPPTARLARRAHAADHGSVGWMFVGGDGGASDCSAGDGGGCGDGGGGGGD